MILYGIIDNVWAWLKMSTPGDLIAVVSLFFSSYCVYKMIRITQKISGNGNVVYANCTITHPQATELHGYADHVLAKLSSGKLRDRTFNYLKLTEKTVLEIPDDDTERVADMLLRIDIGETLYPIGIDTQKWQLDYLSYENDFLQSATNSHMYMCISVAGQTEVDGVIKRNLLISSNLQKRDNGRRNKFGRVQSDGKIEYAPVALVLNGITWWNATADMYRAAGYKPVRPESPKNAVNGFYYVSAGWQDVKSEIVQQWELKKIEDPPPPTHEELKMMIDELNQRFALL